MERKLKTLFDYQRFQKNPHLASLLEETEKRYCNELSDDDLELVTAAGDIGSSKRPVEPEASGDD